MITMILIVLIMFNFNYQNINIIQRINNTFTSLSTTLPSNWIRLIRKEERIIPLYKKSLIKESTTNYFIDNLKGYVNNFNLSFYYYDIKDKKEYEGEYTPAVKISLKYNDYIKSINFEIGGEII